jgi:hypothetical protein
MADCNASLNAFQMCNAHFFLGSLFCVVGLLQLYYGEHGEFVAKMEMALIAFGALGELLGEGLGDSVLLASHPDDFEWNAPAKMVSLCVFSSSVDSIFYLRVLFPIRNILGLWFVLNTRNNFKHASFQHCSLLNEFTATGSDENQKMKFRSVQSNRTYSKVH